MSNQGNTGFKSNRVKTALDAKKLKLTADPLDGSGGKAPIFTIYFNPKTNEPTAAVYTNLPNDKPITGDLTARVLFEMMVVIRMLVASTEEKTYWWELKGHPYMPGEGRSSKEPMPMAKLYIGRDKEGEIFISLLSYDGNRGKIRFVIRDDPYAVLNLRNGTISKAEVSAICAQAYIEAVKEIYAAVVAENYVHPEYNPEGKGKGGGNGGGGGGNNRGGYGNNNNSGGGRAGGDEDDDLPFD